MTNEIQTPPVKTAPRLIKVPAPELSETCFAVIRKNIESLQAENQILRAKIAELKESRDKAWEIIHEYEEQDYRWNCRLIWFKVHQWDLWRHIWNYISICIGRGGQGV